MSRSEKRLLNSPVQVPVALPRGSGLAILWAIGRGRRTVSEIIGKTGLAQSNVSNHLARFRERQWVQAERSGREIRYQIVDPALAAFVDQTGRAGRLVSAAEADRLIEWGLSAYIDAARLVRPDLAEQVASDLLDAGVSWQDISLRVFTPALHRVGELWKQGQLSVAAEHAATAFTQQLMSRLVPRAPSPPTTSLGKVVVGCLAGEHHSVGARLVADLFQASGWSSSYLGADVPGADLLDFVRVQRPDVVALSATADTAEAALRQALDALRQLRGDADRPLLIGGGQWFGRNPEHGLPLDFCGQDSLSMVTEVGRRILREEV